MAKVALLLLQATTIAAPAPDAAGLLLHPVPPQHCADSSVEIVVCAKSPDTYRLPKGGLANEEPSLPKAEWKVFGKARMSIHGEQRALPQGATSQAATVTVKIPF